MKLDFSDNKHYVTPLGSLYQPSERLLKDERLVIDRVKCPPGYAIYASDLVRRNVGVYAGFSKPTTVTISAITYWE